MPLTLDELVDEPDVLGAAPPELGADWLDGLEDPEGAVLALDEFDPQAAAASATRTTRQMAASRAGRLIDLRISRSLIGVMGAGFTL